MSSPLSFAKVFRLSSKLSFLLNNFFYFINLFAPLSIALPILRSRPCLDIGMPVARAIFCLACVIPNARFQENERPGIFMAISFTTFVELFQLTVLHKVYSPYWQSLLFFVLLRNIQSWLYAPLTNSVPQWHFLPSRNW